MPLTEAQQDELRELRPTMGRVKLARHFGVTPNAISGYMTRLNLHAPAKPERVKGLAKTHPAAVKGRTLYPVQVVPPPANTRPRPRSAGAGGRVLTSGSNSAKVGKLITKGAWASMPVFSLALEERATCPRTCSRWLDCYGNSTYQQKRYQHGPMLEARLGFELDELQAMYPKGFVVRLHMLGDFYSIGYVRLWERALQLFPALRVYGYTAWRGGTKIGDAIALLRDAQWNRFAVRTSHDKPGKDRTITLRGAPPASPDIIICPAQLDQTQSCSTCGLCWSPAAREKTIAFILHGR